MMIVMITVMVSSNDDDNSSSVSISSGINPSRILSMAITITHYYTLS